MLRPAGEQAGEEEVVAGPAPLTPIQRWFTETAAGHLDHFNMSVLVDVAAGIDGAVLARAVGAI